MGGYCEHWNTTLEEGGTVQKTPNTLWQICSVVEHSFWICYVVEYSQIFMASLVQIVLVYEEKTLKSLSIVSSFSRLGDLKKS